MQYLAVSEAVAKSGMRLVLSPGRPNPWGESAKAIFRLKGIPFEPVAQNSNAPDPDLKAWTGQESAPVAMFDDERPRTRWDELLLLAERLVPTPRLIPEDQLQRAMMFGFAREIFSEDGLAWNFRLAIFEKEAQSRQDAPDQATIPDDQLGILLSRYDGKLSDPICRMQAILKMLSAQLKSNRDTGSSFIIGNQLSAVDIYWAAFSLLLNPIEESKFPVSAGYRAVTAWVGEALKEALDPVLWEHRDFILENYFTLPLEF